VLVAGWFATGTLFLSLFWPVLAGLVTVWLRDGNYSHCFLVPLISGYFIWERRGAVHHAPHQPRRKGALLLGAAVVLYVLAFWSGIEVAQRLLLVGVLHGIVWFNLGVDVYRRWLFPLCFLFLMIPLPVTLYNEISLPLQLFATTGARWVLTALHLPVVQSGNILTLPSGSIEVVEACSGIRSLLALWTLGVLVCHHRSDLSWRMRAALLAACVPIALALNIARIATGGLLVHNFGIKAAEGPVHDTTGLLFTVGALALFLWASSRAGVGYGGPRGESSKPVGKVSF
jgi:exosortase